ncbi:AMMECR1 domain protein [Dethiosulfovibrio peptidovorans DSM 11002]|uniref:AMMECR1 domain protein n=1 Tax=Dethiosulfovibrio peptidovorans DSM 11002 TaxID=469381 RepID=D2Z860_9BACT|nr:AmmeMemoRadiSam system protein A [Dethiosulfovibrio peptidovorans]EFC91657.1 AMMECR1 domain protein [Dethiosulfovibrio peptidovorans DSM 11002]
MWLWGCLTPHPPIIVDNIGEGRQMEAIDTIEAMEGLAKKLSNNLPDAILILSPHSFSFRGLTISTGSTYEGDMGGFGHPEISMNLDGNLEAVEELVSFLDGKIPIRTYHNKITPLDHGAFVPFWFFRKRWTSMPPVVLANPIGLTREEAYEMGKVLSTMTGKRSWGLVASGDLSHRLTPDAPAGYSPDGRILDERIVESLIKGKTDPVDRMNPETISRAGECGLRSAMALIGLIGAPMDVLSYEGPYGVGYCIALGTVDKPKSGTTKTHPAVRLARSTLEYFLDGKNRQTDETTNKELSLPRACFVSLKKRGQLRGCIGTLSPVRASLAKEIESNAIAAATSDPRFPPVTSKELKEITISVDILSEPERVTDKEQLNPRIYGVIVSKGSRRGVLLPDLEGVDSIDDQLSIAVAKAGLAYTDDLEIERFTVERHGESDEE